MTDEPRIWRYGVEPEHTCDVCGAAAVAPASFCITHLDEAGLASALESLRAHELALDLRGADVSTPVWQRIRQALTRDGVGLDLTRARLAQATFGDDADLSEATFANGADLRGATFGNGAKLGKATFGDDVVLVGVTFGDNAGLGEARFGERADLRDVRFGDHAYLRKVTFGDGAKLRHASFGARMNAQRMTFGDRCDLSDVTFGNRADLRAAVFGQDMDLSLGTFGEEIVLEEAWFMGNADFNASVFLDQRRIAPIYVAGALDLHDARFLGETLLVIEVDAAGLILSGAVFAGPLELRALRARIEASQTTFAGQATIAPLDPGRRPSTVGQDRVDHKGRRLELAEQTSASVSSLRRAGVERLTIARVDVRETRFAGAHGLERLRLVDTAFPEHRGRQRVREEALLDEPHPEPTVDEQRMGQPTVTAGQVAEIYRSLRKGREDSADAPGGNDLYIGEQLMRRRALRERRPRTLANQARRAILASYAWIGGYGVLPIRPFSALVGLLMIAWWAAAQAGLSQGSCADALIYVVRSVILLPNSTNVTTTTIGDGLQAALRVVGPILIGLTALGLRAQIKR